MPDIRQPGIFRSSIFILAITVLTTIAGHAAPKNAVTPLVNGIYKENIRTVQIFREGWEFSTPLIELAGNQRILLKFDEISDGVTNYYYTITHCDADWYPSRLVQSEYMEGFIENPISDYASSTNTTVKYTNYLLSLPNDQVRFLISGNYLVSVFDEANRATPVLTRRFYVLEPSAEIRGEVKKSLYDGYKGRDQAIDFVVDYSRFSIQDPRTEAKVIIMQNARADNCMVNVKPLFVRDNLITYEIDRDQLFPGGNEFRNFETKNLRINGYGVANIAFQTPLYHVTLRTDEIHRERDYRFGSDLNGRFLIKNEHETDPDLESDYAVVHFSLGMPDPLLGGSIYVFGGLTEWQCLPANKMNWNFELKRYEASLFLKQGYYDYQYVYIQNGDNLPDNTLLEGSHVETENDYQFFVYYHGFSSRYDRLIGFRTINSVKR
jgi:hypothetical protein